MKHTKRTIVRKETAITHKPDQIRLIIKATSRTILEVEIKHAQVAAAVAAYHLVAGLIMSSCQQAVEGDSLFQ